MVNVKLTQTRGIFMSMFSHHMGKATLLASLLLMTACGRSENLPTDLSASLASTQTSTSSNSTDSQFKEALPKILLGIEEIRQELHNVRFSGGAPAGSAPAATPAIAAPNTPATATDNPAAPTSPSTEPPAATPASTAPAAPALPSGQDELKKLLAEIDQATYAKAYVEKTELGLDNGKLGKVKLNMYTKKPNTVKLEIIESTAGNSAGAKILYTSNEGTKAKIRPGGGLSFITTELDKADDRLASNNNYTFDDVDLIGVSKRLGDGSYKAKLVGKTTLNGTSLNILKLTTDHNTMDDRIDFEYIGYEPDSHKLRLWEIYAKSNTKTPYFRMTIDLEFPASIPDSTFKL